MQNIKAVIFDLDGLCLDTESAMLVIWTDVLNELGVKTPNFDKFFYAKCCGNGFGTAYARIKEHFNLTQSTEEFLELINARRRHHYNSKPPALKPGLINLLTYLRANDYKAALCTSSVKEILDLKIEKSGLPIELFDAIITGDMVKNMKPNPEPYLLACDVLGVKPSEAIALEDSDVGLTSAYRAGCNAVLVPDMVQNGPQAKKMATRIVKSLNDITPLLEN